MDAFNAIYPIGSIAIGAKPTLGTWEQIQGRFLYASDDSTPTGSTGGASSVRISKENLPNQAIVDIANNSGGWGLQFSQVPNGNYRAVPVSGGASLNITPPYLSVEMWRRTA